MKTVETVGNGRPESELAQVIGATTQFSMEQHQMLIKILQNRVDNTLELRRTGVIIEEV